MYSFGGEFGSADHGTATGVMERWLGVVGKIKIGRSGYEFVYENDTIDIFCHEYTASSKGGYTYLLEGTLSDSAGSVDELLGRLVKICETFGLTYYFDYQRVAEDGTPIGDEIVLDSRR